MSRITTSLRIALAAIVLLVASAGRSTAQDYYGGNASYQQFYDELSPYGEWIYDSQYGYVWVPDAGDDFRPYYTNGYWVNTDYGNTWVSDYDWGWAPFHYGRWTYSNYYGWTWIPGNQWGPAWVSWRSGGGNYGWAPLGPGISINFSFGSSYYVPDYWWTFTPQQYILDRRFHNYSYGPRYNSNYIHKTTIINNTYVNNRNTYIAGPRRRDLEVATGRPVRTVAINTMNRPNRSELRNDRLEIYRPNISETRPRATERPRTFQKAERPLPANNREAAEQFNRGNNGEVRDSRPIQRQDRTPRDMNRPGRNQNDPQRTPVFERNDIDRSNVQQPSRNPVQQPGNPGRIDQPRNRGEINDGRNPDRRPVHQPQQDDQRQQQIDQQRAQQQQIEQQRAQRGQQMDQQRAQQQQQIEQQRAQRTQQMEQQRAQQQQQIEQQRAQRQQIEQQRSQQVEQQRIQRQQIEQQRPQERQPRIREEQRIEQPRSMPRREEPAAAPVREQRVPDGGGEGRPHRGR